MQTVFGLNVCFSVLRGFVLFDFKYWLTMDSCSGDASLNAVKFIFTNWPAACKASICHVHVFRLSYILR